MSRASAPLLLLLVLQFLPASSIGGEQRICKTITVTQGDYQRHRNVSRLRQEILDRVAGCQYIHGDLFILNLGVDPLTEQPLGAEVREMRTDFFDSIEEITGRLRIFRVNLRILALRNLRTIRGYNQIDEYPYYSLEVKQSPYQMELQLPRLDAILLGKEPGSAELTGVLHESLYCPLTRRVSWSALFQSQATRTLNDTVSSVVTGDGRTRVNVSLACQNTTLCDPACPTGCWSAGPAGCQSSHQCRSRSCYTKMCFVDQLNSAAEECCHPNCLGGCRSNQPTGCFSCREVNLGGECVNSCPAGGWYYDVGKAKQVQLNGSMLRVGNICVKTCPAPFLASSDGRDCVSECRPNQVPMENSCRPCAGACRKCNLAGPILTDAEAERLRADGCVIWSTDRSLDVDAGKLRNSSVSVEVLGQLRYMFGGLMLKKAAGRRPGLDFLANLTFVSGNLYLMNLQTRYLGLVSLEKAKFLALSNVSGLCPAWYPSARIQELAAKFTIQRDVKFDNASAECVAAKCHPECAGDCWGPGPGLCVACRRFHVDGVCRATCREVGRYEVNSTACGACHRECATGPGGGCHGPADTDCTRCRGLSESGACVANCSRGTRPDFRGRCYSRALLVGVVLGLGALLLLVVSLPLAVLYYRNRIRKYAMTDLDEVLADSSNPSGMTKLLLVNDDDIVKQKEIGSGAFGTVFKGLLCVSTERGSRELPVAIKVLRGGSPKLGQELLNEASVLARVRHESCIRLVALCLTREPQLITALMPRGCLLDYVRGRRNRIGAERMLQWALQVAQGMAYLQSEGIIHRDLAARNVLLESPDRVRITDFGLARLLNISERELGSTSGLLPVKWLGLECIESGQFTHQSDVWSYGILLWEVCTFGESPYSRHGVRSVDEMLSLLRKGIRLDQPDVCSVDFYNILLSCWLPYPESRPTFTDLIVSVGECLKSPTRYIALAGAGGFDDQVETETAATPTVRGPGADYQNTYITDPTCSTKPDGAATAEEKRALLELSSPQPHLAIDDDDGNYLVPVSKSAVAAASAVDQSTAADVQMQQLQSANDCDPGGLLLPKRK